MNRKLLWNPILKQFIDINPEDALARYKELAPTRENYARFFLYLLDYKAGKLK